MRCVSLRLLLTLWLVLCAPATTAIAAPVDKAPPQPARAWLMLLNGHVVGAHQAQLAVPPASLTKIVTALIWLQKPVQQNEWVTISHRAAAATGSRLGLSAGERYRGSDLLAAMLIISANDACLALAEHSGGSVEGFVRKMNQAAKVLGLKQTRFDNPCGYDAPDQRSAATDLAQLTEIALDNPVFRDLVKRESYDIRRPGGGITTLRSTNQLVGRLSGVRGVKTGFTAQAGKCLIALVERDGHRVLLVLLNSPDRWWAAHGLIESALAKAALD